MTDPATRLTLKVVHPLVHLDRLPDSRPLLPSEEVAELLEVVLVLVKFIVRHGAFGPVSIYCYRTEGWTGPRVGQEFCSR